MKDRRKSRTRVLEQALVDCTSFEGSSESVFGNALVSSQCRPARKWNLHQSRNIGSHSGGDVGWRKSGGSSRRLPSIDRFRLGRRFESQWTFDGAKGTIGPGGIDSLQHGALEARRHIMRTFTIV